VIARRPFEPRPACLGPVAWRHEHRVYRRVEEIALTTIGVLVESSKSGRPRRLDRAIAERCIPAELSLDSPRHCLRLKRQPCPAGTEAGRVGYPGKVQNRASPANHTTVIDSISSAGPQFCGNLDLSAPATVFRVLSRPRFKSAQIRCCVYFAARVASWTMLGNEYKTNQDVISLPRFYNGLNPFKAKRL
jgi:hypothetical protein